MSLFSSLSVSASGMAAQRARAALLVENLANADTTRTPEGGPYRRKDAVFAADPVTSPFSNEFANAIGGEGTGVRVADVVEDTAAPDRRYMPGHPDADAEGYVLFPHVNPAEDMVDLMSASRSYEANVAAVSVTKDMISHTIDLLR
jgi:flagellar basal-body rod protein FlgC